MYPRPAALPSKNQLMTYAYAMDGCKCPFKKPLLQLSSSRPCSTDIGHSCIRLRQVSHWSFRGMAGKRHRPYLGPSFLCFMWRSGHSTCRCAVWIRLRHRQPITPQRDLDFVYRISSSWSPWLESPGWLPTQGYRQTLRKLVRARQEIGRLSRQK
jgi:hypothetical protein